MFARRGEDVNPLAVDCARLAPTIWCRPQNFTTDRDICHVVDIFDEVDEDVRRERMQALTKRYGPLLGGGVAVILVVVAGLTFWRQHQEQAAQEAGAAYLAAARVLQQDQEAGEAAFAEIAAEGPAAYPVLARFKQAEALAAAGGRGAALDVLNGIESLDTQERYKELARLLALGLRSYEESPETLLPLVEPLAAPDRPWRAMALEQAAALEWKMGLKAAARARWEMLSKNVDTPSGVRARAEAALAALPEG